MTVNGNTVTLPTGSDTFGAIDTGTTLISGPEDVVAALYAQIPGYEALTGQNAGFYQYRELLGGRAPFALTDHPPQPARRR